MDENITYPYPSQPKAENFEYGRRIIEAFCEYNYKAAPKIKDVTRCPRAGYAEFGYYRFGSNTVCINVKKARPVVKTPGFSWSYTGWKADLTAAGIIAHETGHYIDDILKLPSKKIAKFVGKEKAVSSYEPNHYEIFAEAMKVFILNPDLLRQGRPKRYEFLTKECGLEPVILDKWDYVMGHAHAKLISAARTFISNK